jgi:hypothetical protein
MFPRRKATATGARQKAEGRVQKGGKGFATEAQRHREEKRKGRRKKAEFRKRD